VPKIVCSSNVPYNLPNEKINLVFSVFHGGGFAAGDGSRTSLMGENKQKKEVENLNSRIID
jgi:hypothetical protein